MDDALYAAHEELYSACFFDCVEARHGIEFHVWPTWTVINGIWYSCLFIEKDVKVTNDDLAKQICAGFENSNIKACVQVIDFIDSPYQIDSYNPTSIFNIQCRYVWIKGRFICNGCIDCTSL